MTTLDRIVIEASRVFGVSVAALVAGRGNKRREVTAARQAVVYVARRADGRAALKTIGRAVGLTDHATASHALRRVPERAAQNYEYAMQLVDLADAVGVSLTTEG